MANLIDIIKDDFTVPTQILRGLVKGIVRGAYTPILMSTGIKQFQKEEDPNSRGSHEEFVAAHTYQLATAAAIGAGGTSYLLFEGKLGWGLGALALTNMADYLVHAYKRSKE